MATWGWREAYHACVLQARVRLKDAAGTRRVWPSYEDQPSPFIPILPAVGEIWRHPVLAAPSSSGQWSCRNVAAQYKKDTRLGPGTDKSLFHRRRQWQTFKCKMGVGWGLIGWKGQTRDFRNHSGETVIFPSSGSYTEWCCYGILDEPREGEVL